MTTKAKLVSTIAAFCLVLALMVVGVLAASSATINLGGSIGFTATDVIGEVSMAASGDVESTSQSKFAKSQEFNAQTTTTTFDWDTNGLVFQKADGDRNATITVTITVTNEATDGRTMYVRFTTMPTLTDDADGKITLSNVTYGAQDTQYTGVNTDITVTKGTTVDIEFSFTVNDLNATVTGTWDAALVISNTAYAAG